MAGRSRYTSASVKTTQAAAQKEAKAPKKETARQATAGRDRGPEAAEDTAAQDAAGRGRTPGATEVRMAQAAAEQVRLSLCRLKYAQAAERRTAPAEAIQGGFGGQAGSGSGQSNACGCGGDRASGRGFGRGSFPHELNRKVMEAKGQTELLRLHDEHDESFNNVNLATFALPSLTPLPRAPLPKALTDTHTTATSI